MNIIRYFIYSLCVVLCYGCTSNSPAIKFYRLSSHVHDMPPMRRTLSAEKTIIVRVYLSKILQQPGIINNLGENEINIAHYHRWAEPLDKAIERSLIHGLNKKTSSYNFEALMSGVKQSSRYTLRLSIDSFAINDNASVTLSGQYRLLDENAASLLQQSFNIEQSLKKDGYSYAVEKLNQTLFQLVNKILVDLNNIQ